jgi:hypothetical protein
VAWIGKDGKDDVAKLAVLGGAQVLAAMTVVTPLTTASRYHRADYALPAAADVSVTREHVDYLERLTLIGFIDSYGGNDPLKPFAVIQTSDAAAARALASASALVTKAGASVSITAV